MKKRVFLREHAAETVDIFDSIVFWSERGDPSACAILDGLDAAYEAQGSPPECGLIVTLAIQQGWFDHDMQRPLEWAGKCDH